MQTTEQTTTTPFINTDFEVRSLDASCINESELIHPWWHNLKYAAAGILFGLFVVLSVVLCWLWFVVLFGLLWFVLFGVMGSAIAVGIISIQLIKRFRVKTIYGEPVFLPEKKFNKGQIYGGLLFGLGWAITGACPGPLFAQIGTGLTVTSVTLLSAIAGTWVYGYFRDRLPH
jgi:uncharacterized membrane protein YedE/YeeE